MPYSVPGGGVKANPPQESLTDFAGLISGVWVGSLAPPMLATPLSPYLASSLTVTRTVDWLSPQFTSAQASKRVLPQVSIQTPSGHVVTLRSASVVQITKSGFRNPDAPGSPPVGPGMEAITWNALFPPQVDGRTQNNSYNWNALDFALRPGRPYRL